MKVKIYTVNRCTQCQNIKNFFNNLNICYEEVRVNRFGENEDGITLTEFSHLFSNKSLLNYVFPQVFIDDKHIGGLFETLNYFKEMLE